MPSKIAIIGTAPTSRALAPYDDPSWDIWACSPGNQGAVLPRVSVWFELHAIVDLVSPESRSWAAPYVEWLKHQSFPIYMQEKNDLVPQAVPFPMHEMVEAFGRNWFTSSIAWMMALAIAQKPEHIGIFGVDMAADQEHYSAQKSGCLRFIEIAQERGIRVSIPRESCLGKSAPLYGYSEATPFGRRLNVTEYMVANRRAEMAAEFARLQKEIAFYDGALEQIRYIKRTWLDGTEVELNLGELEQRLADTSAATADPVDVSLPEEPEAEIITYPPHMRRVGEDA